MNWGKLLSEYGVAIITFIIGAALSWLASWYYFRRAEKPKLLGWETVSRNRIISATEDQRQHLSVVYKGVEVKNPYVLVLRVLNSGKQEIRQSDFTEPISFDFGDTALLAGDVTAKSDSRIKATPTIDISRPNYRGYTPDFLNEEEWFELQFITDGFPGVKMIHASPDNQSRYERCRGEIPCPESDMALHLDSVRGPRSYQLHHHAIRGR